MLWEVSGPLGKAFLILLGQLLGITLFFLDVREKVREPYCNLRYTRVLTTSCILAYSFSQNFSVITDHAENVEKDFFFSVFLYRLNEQNLDSPNILWNQPMVDQVYLKEGLTMCDCPQWKVEILRTSLVVHWWRVLLPMQGTHFGSLVWEDPSYLRATKSVCRNYWAVF